ncbi:hypothetical protein ACDI16_02385 [Oceanobacillus caeni]|uniref:hypothetical protein n=1 Tax=Virgibacillus sp. SK37 TaxID=403957 RepID=UPI0011A951A8|nr:hypothetical protein [Virgibacillus sp. SK37]
MNKVDYKNMAEAIIKDFLLSDYRNVVRESKYHEDAEHHKEIIVSRLASLCRYDNLPVSEVIRLAEKRNETFSFLNNPIDTKQLKKELEESLQRDW